jgi:protein involved in polysaccharide export with SLBB domain
MTQSGHSGGLLTSTILANKTWRRVACLLLAAAVLLVLWYEWHNRYHAARQADGHATGFSPDSSPTRTDSDPETIVASVDQVGYTQRELFAETIKLAGAWAPVDFSEANADMDLGDGDCCGSCPVGSACDAAPCERHKQPDYVISPPDVLSVVVHAEGVDRPLLEAVEGEHLVGPGGHIDLGDAIGTVDVGDVTLAVAQERVRESIRAQWPAARVWLSVQEQNSKVVFVIVEGAKQGDMVYRIPLIADRRVGDTLAELPRQDRTNHDVWIARPRCGGTADEILSVNVDEIAADDDSPTNFHLQAGDRIFVTRRRNELQRVLDFVGDCLDLAIGYVEPAEECPNAEACSPVRPAPTVNR